LRAFVVDGTKPGDWIEGDTSTVAALLHAIHAVVLHHEFPGNGVTRSQFNHEMTAPAAASAGNEIGVRVDGANDDSPARD